MALEQYFHGSTKLNKNSKIIVYNIEEPKIKLQSSFQTEKEKDV